MPLLYRLLADATVVVHMAYVLAVLVGAVVVPLGGWCGWSWVRRPLWRWIHLTMIGVVVLESWCGMTCPLTTWEHQLRELAGQTSYQGDFLANWVHELLFIDAPPWAFTVAYSLFGLLIAVTWWIWPPRRSPGECRLKPDQ